MSEKILCHRILNCVFLLFAFVFAPNDKYQCLCIVLNCIISERERDTTCDFCKYLRLQYAFIALIHILWGWHHSINVKKQSCCFLLYAHLLIIFILNQIIFFFFLIPSLLLFFKARSSLLIHHTFYWTNNSAR